MASLKRRTLANPADDATSCIGRLVSSIRRFANSTRLACATVSGDAPTCSRNKRRRWRSPIPSLAARAPTPSRSSAPSSIKRSARRTVADGTEPRRTSRRGLRSTPKARPIAGLEGCGGRLEEVAVLGARTRGADRPGRRRPSSARRGRTARRSGRRALGALRDSAPHPVPQPPWRPRVARPGGRVWSFPDVFARSERPELRRRRDACGRR